MQNILANHWIKPLVAFLEKNFFCQAVFNLNWVLLFFTLQNQDCSVTETFLGFKFLHIMAKSEKQILAEVFKSTGRKKHN